MKQGRKDELIREQMKQLDALSGGIVFGKDEAWDRLQTRMDRSPRKRILLYSGMAAALALLISVSMLWRDNGRVVPQQAAAIKVESVPLGQQKESAPLAKQIAGKKVAPLIAKRKIKQDLIVETPVQQIATVDSIVPAQNKMPAVAKPDASPVVRVVYIDDAERGNARNRSGAANTVQVDVSKLRTVHINEVEREQLEIKQLLKENRMSLGRRLIYRPSDNIERDAPTNYSDSPQHNPLKAFFNVQN